MTPAQTPKPSVFRATSEPDRAKTALMFILAAILLIGGALTYRAIGQGSQGTDSGMSHCLEGDYLATLALPTYAQDRHAEGKLWQDARLEYRTALLMAPRLARARRGLAAIEWLQGHAQKAQGVVSAPVDVADSGREAWRATQIAFHAAPAPPDFATLTRFKQALAPEDLGWSRLVARTAISSSDSEAARIAGQMLAIGEAKQQARRTREALRGISILLGIGVFVLFLIFPTRDRIVDISGSAGLLVAAFLIGMAAHGLPSVLASHLLRHYLSTASDSAYYVVMLFTDAVGLALIAIVAHATLRRNGESIQAFGWESLLAPVWGVGAYLAVLPVMFFADALSIAAVGLFPDVETPINPAAWMADSAQGWSLLVVFISVCVVGPLAEELLFRGLLLRGLSKAFGFWGGAILSSAVFAALHPQLPLGFLPIFCTGLGLCVVYRRSGSLTACWALHSINNVMALLGTLSASDHLRLFH